MRWPWAPAITSPNPAIPAAWTSPSQKSSRTCFPKSKLYAPAARFSQVHPRRHSSAKVRQRQPLLRATAARIEILAIGTSTGGPNALAELLPAIPSDFPVPIVIVQHMPPLFTRMLAERLNKKTAIRVHEGSPGMKLEPGHAWIAPGDHHMIVERHGTAVQLATNQGPPENSCRPAVDVLFRSVAAAFGANTLAVVLTGMGSDGVLGSKVVRGRGGRVYVQDEASSVVWGMPGQMAAAGFSDNIFPLNAMAAEIDRHTRASRQPPKQAAGLAPGNSG
jgi:two-component system, chemotaxis family, protein-glutamate methylesterase/glutaminase